MVSLDVPTRVILPPLAATPGGSTTTKPTTPPPSISSCLAARQRVVRTTTVQFIPAATRVATPSPPAAAAAPTPAPSPPSATSTVAAPMSNSVLADPVPTRVALPPKSEAASLPPPPQSSSSSNEAAAAAAAREVPTRASPPPKAGEGHEMHNSDADAAPPPAAAASPRSREEEEPRLVVDKEEGILWDVLNELDRERERRAELEAQVRDLSAALSGSTLQGGPSSPDTGAADVGGSSPTAGVHNDRASGTAQKPKAPPRLTGGDDNSDEARTVAQPQQPPSPTDDGTTSIAKLSAKLSATAAAAGLEEGKDVPEIISSLIDKVDSLNRHQEETKIDADRIHQEAKVAAERMSRREIVSLRTERDGLVELLNAMTSDNDAVLLSAAAESGVGGSSSNMGQPATLPLHVVRLLEIMPWDERAQAHASALEEVHEWQVYDTKTGKWSQHIKHFPKYFKALTVSTPAVDVAAGDTTNAAGSNRSNKRLGGRFMGKGTSESPPKGCVLTNAASTRILNIEDGYPLPNGGTWEWVGGWRINRNGDSSSSAGRINSDGDGWTYASLPRHLISRTEHECHENPGEENEPVIRGGVSAIVPMRKFRRRRWTRRRVLVSYPSISERTRQYLTLLAQKAALNVTVSKMSEQLVDMKTKLTESEERLERNAREMSVKLGKAEADVRARDERIKALEKEGSKLGTSGRSSPRTNASGVADRVKGLQALGGKVLDEWSRRRLEDEAGGGSGGEGKSEATTDDAPPWSPTDSNKATAATSPVSDTSETGSDGGPTTRDGFSWKKLGRSGGGFIEHIKRSGKEIATAAQMAKQGLQDSHEARLQEWQARKEDGGLAAIGDGGEDVEMNGKGSPTPS